MNGNLSLGVCSLRTTASIFGLISAFSCDNLPHSKFPRNAETQASNHGTRPEICELVRVIAYTLSTTIVAVDESGVGCPLL